MLEHVTGSWKGTGQQIDHHTGKNHRYRQPAADKIHARDSQEDRTCRRAGAGYEENDYIEYKLIVRGKLETCQLGAEDHDANDN